MEATLRVAFKSQHEGSCGFSDCSSCAKRCGDEEQGIRHKDCGMDEVDTPMLQDLGILDKLESKVDLYFIADNEDSLIEAKKMTSQF